MRELAAADFETLGGECQALDCMPGLLHFQQQFAQGMAWHHQQDFFAARQCVGEIRNRMQRIRKCAAGKIERVFARFGERHHVFRLASPQHDFATGTRKLDGERRSPGTCASFRPSSRANRLARSIWPLLDGPRAFVAHGAGIDRPTQPNVPQRREPKSGRAVI